jgi:hypothetical protein
VTTVNRRDATAPLAIWEVRRFVTNPIFLVGVALAAYAAWRYQRVPQVDINEVVPYPAIFIGAVGMFVSYWLTHSMRGSADVIDTTPTAMPVRAAATCCVAIVTGVCGALSLAALLMFQHVAEPVEWGAYGHADRLGVLVSQILMPAIGGPLLGVALGRWISFPGGSFVAFVVLYAWVTVGYIVSAPHPYAMWATAIRLLSPFTFFTSTATVPGAVRTFAGSPWFYVCFQVCLCALAVLAALLRGTEGAGRRRVHSGLAVAGIAAIVTYALAVTL